jgi:chromosome partitioning protein
MGGIAAMRTIATVNHKGGSGKTTTAVSLSAALAETGRRVLLIDLDPQASASAWVAAPTESRTLLDALLGGSRLSDAVYHTGTPGLDIVPSSMWLLGAERRLAEIRAGEGRLAQLIGDLPDRWDYLMVDCPPALGALTANALASVEELLIPVEAHVMAVAGLVQLLRGVEAARERVNPRLHVSGIVMCRVDSRTRHGPEVVERLRGRFGDMVCSTVIRENVRLAECPSFRKPITQYDPRCSGAIDYRSLACEVIAQEVRHAPAA